MKHASRQSKPPHGSNVALDSLRDVVQGVEGRFVGSMQIIHKVELCRGASGTAKAHGSSVAVHDVVESSRRRSSRVQVLFHGFGFPAYRSVKGRVREQRAAFGRSKLFGLGRGLVLSVFANGRENFRRYPIRKSISFGLVGPESEFVYGWFGDKLDLLLSPAKGGEFPHTLPFAGDTRQRLTSPINIEGRTYILGRKPRGIRNNGCSDLIAAKRKNGR